MSDSLLTRQERLAFIRREIKKREPYLSKGYAIDTLKILNSRGLKRHNGDPYTLDQVRHTKAGNLALMEVAQVIIEVAERNKMALLESNHSS